MDLFMERCTITLINIFLPPLSVMLVAGVGMDALVNTLWLLCGVVPGHAHGLYVTWTYFSRRRRVRGGRWPGGPRPLIYSRRVVNGGASDAEVRRLWAAEQAREEEGGRRRRRTKKKKKKGAGGRASRRGRGDDVVPGGRGARGRGW